MTDKRIERVPITLTGRVGYPKLNPTNPPLQGLDNQRKRWSLNLYIDPNSAGYKRAKADIAKAVAAFTTLHGYEPAKFPNFKVITEWENKTKTRKTDPSLIGLYSIELGKNAEKKDGGLHPPVPTLDQDKEPIPHSDIYPGCYARAVAVLDEYVRKNERGAIIAHGLSFNLKLVQFMEDGTRMGGDNTDYSKYLDDDVEEDEPKRFLHYPRYGAPRSTPVADDDI